MSSGSTHFINSVVNQSDPSDLEIEKALLLLRYRKNYYKQYQKRHKDKYAETQRKYVKKIYEDETRLKEMKLKHQEYYKNVVKPRREKARQLRALMINE